MKTPLICSLVLISTFGYAQIVVKANRNTHVLKERNQATFNEPLALLEQGEPLNLAGYYGDYFTVLHDGDTGFVYYPYIEQETPGIAEFKNKHTEAYKNWLTKNGYKSEAERVSTERLNRYIRQFGAEAGRKVYSKMIWIGMTNEMAKSSIGLPESVNSTKTSNMNQEQWVYHNKYLYFEDGVLTAIQETKDK